MNNVQSPFKGTVLEKTHCTINESAYMLSCHRNTILNRLDSGIFTKIKPNGSRGVYLDLSEIKRYLAGEEPIIKKDAIEAKSKVSTKGKLIIKKKAVKKQISKNSGTTIIEDKSRKKATTRKIRNYKIYKKVYQEATEAEEIDKKLKILDSETNKKTQNNKARASIDKSFKKHTPKNTFYKNVVSNKITKSKVNYDDSFKKEYKKIEEYPRKSNVKRPKERDNSSKLKRTEGLVGGAKNNALKRRNI